MSFCFRALEGKGMKFGALICEQDNENNTDPQFVGRDIFQHFG